ncbi:MAG: hypothetical protein ABR607_16130 [Pyrinomonadaceae bacterium]
MAEAAQKKIDDTESLSKKELQRDIEKTRESVSETVSEIKETVSEQYQAAKQTVVGVLDYRERFTEEPLVWSLGALSAGFALGYTMGYAHKNSKGGKKRSEIAAFADSLIGELSSVGNVFVMPKLNDQIKKLFGFDFSDLLDEVGSASPASKTRRKPRANRTTKKTKGPRKASRKKS